MSKASLVGGKVNVKKYKSLLQSENDLKGKLQKLFQKMKKIEASDKAEIAQLTELLNSQNSNTTNDKGDTLKLSAQLNSLKMDLQTANTKLSSCRNACLSLEEEIKIKNAKIKTLKEQPGSKAPTAVEKLSKSTDKKLSVKEDNAIKDDLTLISGVGPKLKEKLYSEGITQFEQIAGWKASDLREFDDRLSFKGRIKRDNWVKQAKALMKK